TSVTTSWRACWRCTPFRPDGTGLGRVFLLRSLWLLVWGAAACGAAAPASMNGTGGCDGRQIVLVNCSGCHDGSASATGFLDLRTPQAIVQLRDQPASGPKCSGMGLTLVNGDGSGLLVSKLRAPPPCGDQMPQGTFPLSSQEIACVEQYVASLVAS